MGGTLLAMFIFVCEILPLILISIVGVSIYPLIAFEIANNAEHDETFAKLFKRLDSSTYFQDDIIIRLRKKYEAEYRDRLKQVYTYIAVLLLAVFVLGYAGYQIDMPESNRDNLIEISSVIGGMVAFAHVIGSVIVFARLGAAKARLAATKPISDSQREEMESIIFESPDSTFLVEFMNQNMKSTLAYIDVLNLKYQSKKIKVRVKEKELQLEDQKRQHVLSSLNK